MTNKILKATLDKKFSKISDFNELDKKIKKIESLKVINLIMSYVNYRDDRSMLKYVSRNIAIWKMCLLIVESYVSSKNISEKEIIDNIQCSAMTANTYIKELVELGFIYLKADILDKRKKNIFPSKDFINEMYKFIEYLQKKITELSL